MSETLRLADPPQRRRKPTGDPMQALLWELHEAAAMLRVSPRTLKRMAASKELPAEAVVHVGRRRLFSRRALEAWIASGCPAPASRRTR